MARDWYGTGEQDERRRTHERHKSAGTLTNRVPVLPHRAHQIKGIHLREEKADPAASGRPVSGIRYFKTHEEMSPTELQEFERRRAPLVEEWHKSRRSAADEEQGK